MLSRKEFSKLCLSTFTPTTLVDIWVVKSLKHSVHCPLSGSQDDLPHLGHLDPLAVGIADGVEGLGVAVVAERVLGERGSLKYSEATFKIDPFCRKATCCSELNGQNCNDSAD